MTTVDELDQVDRSAFELAMQLARKEPGRSKQIDDMLSGGKPWLSVAMFASYCCQTTNLNLTPWEIPPCWVYSILDDPGPMHSPQESGGWRAATKLLKEMRKHGISDWHPDPQAAVAAAKAAA
jgi:hypothetical protein